MQVDDLTRNVQLQEIELERTTKQLKEAIEVAGEESSKCKAAKEVIKSLTAQVSSMFMSKLFIQNILNVFLLDKIQLEKLGGCMLSFNGSLDSRKLTCVQYSQFGEFGEQDQWALILWITILIKKNKGSQQ